MTSASHAPLYFLKYRVKIERYIHSETQERKGLADIHIATALRYVERLIESMPRDVVTPRNLCDAIKYGDGTRGMIAELFDVDFDSSTFKVWDEGMKPGGRLGKIGLVNDIGYMYRNNSLEDKHLEEIGEYTKEYEFSEPIYWRLFVGESICMDSLYNPCYVDDRIVDQNSDEEHNGPGNMNSDDEGKVENEIFESPEHWVFQCATMRRNRS